MKQKGYIYAVIAAILFGSAGLFVKFAYSTGLNAVRLLICQYVIAVSIMFSLMFFMNRKKLYVSKKELLHLIILGTIGNTFMTVFFYKSFECLPMAMVTMMLYTYPILVFLYQFFIGREKLSLKKIGALIMALGGCVLTLNILSGKFEYSTKGIIFGFLSAIFYSFMNIYSENKLQSVDSLTINGYSTLFSLVTLLLYESPTFLFSMQYSKESLVNITILAIFCEIIPLTLLYASLKYIGAVKVSIISNLEIPTAMLLSIFLLKEAITGTQIIGAVLIIVAVYMIKE